MRKMIAISLLGFLASSTQVAIAQDHHEHHQHAHEEHVEHKKHESGQGHHDESSHEAHNDNKAHNKHEGHGEHEKHDEHGHEEGVSTISNAIALQVGIDSQLAGPYTLQQSISCYGRLSTAPEHSSHVRARFPGVITSVTASIGDKVKAGDLLAKVESNESLKKYSIRAPIAGTIVQRHANVGEVTQEQVLFSISNFEPLWAELRVFPSQRSAVREGQAVTIQTDIGAVTSKIEHIIPAMDNKPYLIARAKIDNVNAPFTPGLMVEGRIVTRDFRVAVAVKNTAIQTLQGQTGVFVKHAADPLMSHDSGHGHADHKSDHSSDHNSDHNTDRNTGQSRYQFKALLLGQHDDHYTEVISGLDAGEMYVTQNSYLIKADIEKSEAKHDH